MNRVPPHDLDAERAVLGACLVSEKALALSLAELSPVDFYAETHRVIYAAIKAAARTGAVDHVSVADELKNVEELERTGGRQYVFQLVESVPTAVNAHRYAKIVVAASKARGAIDAAERLKESCYGRPDEYAEAPQRAIAELEEVLRRDSSEGARPIRDGLDELATWMHEARENKGITGIRTGIPKLDQALKGLNPGRLYIVAGRPGAGKSLVCGQICLSAARRGKRVLLQSPEMRLHEYLRRLATASAGVSGERVEEGKVTKEEEKRIFAEGAKMHDLPFFVDDRGTQTVADIRRNVVRYEPDLLVVDYLQRLMPDDRRPDRYLQVSQMSFDLDRIKKDFDIPVVAAAQLSRAVEQRHDKHPMLSDLRDSGSLEQDADAVVMLFRPSHYADAPENELEFRVEKNRHGSLFNATLFIEEGMWITDQRKWSA